MLINFQNRHIYKLFRGQSRVRTCVLVREQIYSLSPLTARPSAQILQNLSFTLTKTDNRAEEGSRTPDLLITNQLLYQLSYFGTFLKKFIIKKHSQIE